jgi:hypothetical protein
MATMTIADVTSGMLVCGAVTNDMSLIIAKDGESDDGRYVSCTLLGITAVRGVLSLEDHMWHKMLALRLLCTA